MRHPDKALSKNEFDRALGYSFTLLKGVIELRSKIDTYSTQIEYLSSLPIDHSSFGKCQTELDILIETTTKAINILVQLKRVLQAAPETSETTTTSLLSQLTSNDSKLIGLINRVEKTINLFSQTITNVSILKNKTLQTHDEIKSTIKSVNQMASSLSSLSTDFSSNFDNDQKLEFSAKFTQLSKKLKSIGGVIEETLTTEETLSDDQKLNKLLERVMLIF